MDTELVSIYTTLPDRDSANRLGRTLVEERLAACINTFPISSIYQWQGKIEETAEWAVLVKTRADLQPDTVNRIRELHPYEVPAVIVYGIEFSLPAYAEWVRASTREGPR